MQICFLAADAPICKAYGLSERGELTKTSYPHINEFTSYTYEITTIDEFYTAIVAHAAAGNCLLKGLLLRPLKNESRAGSTSPESLTQWICLDFDGFVTDKTVDQILEQLGCGDVDYILQWSASQGINNGLHCHILMFLETPCHPTLLKIWLKQLNLSHLSAQISLARSHNALKWPLDITTCQNDKLLYIAPPTFAAEINNPLSVPRIELHTRSYRYLPPPATHATNKQELERFNELRIEAGFKPRKTYKENTKHDIPYLCNPKPAEHTGIKTERGFVYFNLNGGDSWGYYHPIDNPSYIFNFKGEPIYRTADLLPKYWKEIKERVQRLEPDSTGQVYLAFRDFESATYWNGIYDSTTRRLTKFAAARSESQLRNFMRQHGLPLGDFVPDWDINFDPHGAYVLDQKNKRLNMYRPPELQYHAETEVPPTIRKVIYHATGSDPAIYEHFLNWLAVIAQTLGMTQTAWVVHGVQGTGKGVMFNHILTPLFGEHNVTSRRMEELGSDFTEFMKNKFIVFIDEVQAGSSQFHEKVSAKLKSLIVEPRISVREMYHPSTLMKNYTNLIFASNHPQPVHIAADDRRFNVGAYQHTPITLTTHDISLLRTEVEAFYGYLKTRAIDIGQARTPLITADRQRIIETSRPAIDQAIEALKKGNLSFFQDLLVKKTELISARNQLAYAQYQALVDELQHTQRTRLPRDDLMILLRWCSDHIPDTPNKFTAMLRHHSLELSPLWIDGAVIRGYDVKNWLV